jgi:hypothetical protein
MPLRDHFRPPLDNLTSWEGLHGGWPMVIVQTLKRRLPRRFVAAPRVHSGAFVETGLPTQHEYEVRVYDSQRGRRLVAAVEIVSPANKDRPDHRRAFVAKCAALLQQLVSVVIIDLVTTQDFNVYQELLELIGHPADSHPSPLYAAACRTTKRGDDWRLEAWAHGLALGQPLPTLPLWLADDLAVPLELELSYETACRDLDVP